MEYDFIKQNISPWRDNNFASESKARMYIPKAESGLANYGVNAKNTGSIIDFYSAMKQWQNNSGTHKQYRNLPTNRSVPTLF